MNKSTVNLQKRGRFTLAAITAAITLIGLSSAHAALFDLGQAGGYAAFILPNGSIDMTINGGAAVNGDVAVSGHSHLDLGSGAKVGITAGTGTVVSGTIYLNPGATVKLDNQPPSSVVQRDLTQAVADAFAANLAAAALSPTQTFANGLDIKNQFTITGNGGLNVISLSNIKLHGDGLLTLSGSASDYFIFNITGTYTQSSKSNVQLLGGVLPENVLWNFIGSGNGANIGASNQVTYGTFLSPYRDFSITDTTLYGSVISGGHLAIGSKALVVSPPSVIPEVSFSAIWIGFAGLICAFHVRRKWTKAPASKRI